MPNDGPQEVVEPFHAMKVISINDFNMFLDGEITAREVKARAFRAPFDFKIMHDALPVKTPPNARLAHSEYDPSRLSSR